MTPVYVAIPLLTLAAVVVWLVVSRSRTKTDEQLLAERREFARQVGGVEYRDAGRTRPSFGHFPTEGAADAPQPFDYAVEFKRGATRVLAFEKRTRRHSPGGSTVKLAHDRVVQIPAPPTARVWIGPELLAVQDLGLKAQIVPGLTVGRHHQKLVVASPDEALARQLVTPETLTWLTARRGPWFSPIVLEHGTLRTDATPGDRLTPANMVGTADVLIEFLDLLLPRTR
ncbi:hypothetical protein [Saccharomonospora sp. NB11]|uniref:hypothetical protein n=1 Tax=Saccharomonospora sp. NB11 TaxID=1642298 RepID=UPI0018D0DE90|nr:hypothetical protein [Saccharomonospora sp. NB11]